jgi:hypothetical protein
MAVAADPNGEAAHWPPASRKLGSAALLDALFLSRRREPLTNKAGSLGATTVMPVTEVPNTGKFLHFVTHGALVALSSRLTIQNLCFNRSR